MSSSTFDRRAFLRRAGLAGSGAVALTALGRRPVARADEELAPFVHGVASGDPLSDRVVLWTRWSPPGGTTDEVELVVRVYSDPELSTEVRSTRRSVGPATDFCCKVDVGQLSPATTYYYQFTAPDGRVSLVGRTRTLPAPGTTPERFRAAVVSCSNYTGGYFNGYAVIAEQDDVDVVLHLGDYIYEYGNGEDRYGPPELAGERDHVPPVEMATLDAYRARHGHYKLDPDLRRLHQLFPFITTWDDHESTNDSWAGGAENHADGDVDGDGRDWAARKADAQRAYSEWMPIRTDDPARIYRSFPVGDLADLIHLDTRLEGRDEQAATILEPNLFTTAIDDPARRLISQEQLAWLGGQLVASQERGATWRILGQQVMFMQWDAGQLVDTSGYENASGQDAPDLMVRTSGNTLNPDAWDGYTAERERVFDLIDDNGITDFVVLTGDIHTSWAADLPRNAGNPYDPVTRTGYEPATATGSRGVEFVTPSITSDNFNEILAHEAGAPEPFPEGSSAPFEAGTMAENPHIKMVDLDRHGFMTLDVTPERIVAEWFHTVSRVEPTTELHAFRPLKDAWMVEVGGHRVLPVATRAEVAPNDDPAPEATVGSDDAGTSGAAGVPGGVGGGVAQGSDLAATGGGSAALGAAALGLAAAVRLRSRSGDEAAGD